jgi:transcriptional regulator with XRE-family HTH domain
MSNKIKIGARVKTLAKEKGIALYVLEEKSHISRGSISKWDDINPSFEKVCRVAEILDVSVDKLI